MVDDDVAATPNGLIHCLRMLTDEALLLRLHRTYAALQGALNACQLEVAASSIEPPFGSTPIGLSIH